MATGPANVDHSKIMVAIPTRGYVLCSLVTRLMQLQEKYPDIIYHVEQGGLSVSHVRNSIVQKFLKTDCTVLIQVDDDVVPRMSIPEMADHPYDIVGATYHIFRHEMNLPFPGVFKWTGTTYRPIDEVFGRTGLVKCDAVVTGCMAVKRQVFEHPELTAPFAMKYTDEGLMNFSDDIHFCHRARQLGFSIYADYDRHADHCPTGVSMNLLSYQYQEAYILAMQKEREKPRIVTPNA